MTAVAKGIGPYPIVLGRDGLEPEVLAGLDGGVVRQGTSTTASYLTQVTAGGFPCGERATIQSIKGRTMVWNQLAPALAASSYTAWQFTDASFSDGVFTGTIKDNTSSLYHNVAYTAGHRYMMLADVKAPANVSVALAFVYAGVSASTKTVVGIGDFERNAVWYTATGGPSGGNDRIVLRNFDAGNAGNTISAKNVMLFDLTQMFGSGNEPTTVAEFERMFPASYYAYDAGSLKSVDVEALNSYDSSNNLLTALPLNVSDLRGVGSTCDELTATERVTRIGVRAYQSGDESDSDVVTDGTNTAYVLDEPTTTPISPALGLTYRCEAGGTETFVVPTGHVSAPPTVETLYAIDSADLAASIAPVEGPKASTNYAVNSLLMLGGTLCKVTTAVATGEDIVIGTNVSKTTLAAEIAALS